ncbi:hypothetical protein LguiA_030810 [Lonicera macranthoides]
MASFLSLLLFSLISITFSISKAFELPPPKAFHLPIRKDPKTLQYYNRYSHAKSRCGDRSLRPIAMVQLRWLQLIVLLPGPLQLEPFDLCIPSSSEEGLGDIYIGGGPYYMPPTIGDFSKSLMSTPLIINPVSTAPVSTEGDPSDEYFIGVKSIRVDGKVVNFDNSLLTINKNGNGGTKLSTITLYTVLQSSIHKALVSTFVMAAKARKMKRVASSESVKWRFYGENSMVKVKKDVMGWGKGSCLIAAGETRTPLAREFEGLLMEELNGGLKTRTSMILSGLQLENYVLEFDLVSSKLGALHFC